MKGTFLEQVQCHEYCHFDRRKGTGESLLSLDTYMSKSSLILTIAAYMHIILLVDAVDGQCVM